MPDASPIIERLFMSLVKMRDVRGTKGQERTRHGRVGSRGARCLGIVLQIFTSRTPAANSWETPFDF